MENKCKEIKFVKIDDIIPNPKNPNKHTPEQIERLCKIIKRTGFRRPLTISNQTGFIVVGHGRFEAAKKLEFQELPCIFQDYENEAQEYQDMVADNAIATWAELDIEEVKLSAQNFKAEDPSFDFELIGFENFEIENNQSNSGNTEADTVPDIQENIYGVKEGDLWQLGEHRLLCGDCTIKENVDRLMGGEKANLLMTSPPYWVGKDYEKQNSEAEIDQFINKAVDIFIRHVKIDESRIVINTGTGLATKIGEKNTRTILLLDKWINEFKNKSWLLRYIRMWFKGGGQARPRRPIDDVVYHGTEFILVFYHPEGKKRGQNRLEYKWTQQDNWSDIKGDCQENMAGYPVELPLRNVLLYTIDNEIVLEPFSGNGTNFIACEKTNRKCYGMEINPYYCSIIIKRWEEFTGKKAILEKNINS